MALTLNALPGLLEGTVMYVGVGNRMRGDDAAGPLVIDALGKDAGIGCIDAGVAPENYAEWIARETPGTVVIIDSMAFGERAGEIRVFAPEELCEADISTHGGLRPVCEYLAARGVPRIYIVGVQASGADLGELPCEDVRRAVEVLVNAIKDMREHA
jgi:hydrogenase 3 maturation protease